MSVHGEFQRALATLVTFLRNTQDATCEAKAAALETCSAAAREDLSAAARHTLDVCAAAPTAELSQLEHDEYAESAEHLAAICRSLLG
ncbi:MAG: hypothetical protein JRH16_04445 [Deltaproteobacteria bacterium]|nr:hypothetical protein [Deltaproteobacteria bacterium]MBW2361333.1 hypothetical protein [Deltaproteobacteria bacterium]